MNKKQSYITPIGVAEQGCFLQTPDYGNPEIGYGNPRGWWKVNLTMPLAAARPLMDMIVSAHEVNYKALVAEFRKNPPALIWGRKPQQPYVNPMPFVLNDDSTVTFEFKSFASFLDPTTNEFKPLPFKVVDSKGKPIDHVPAIGGGSEIKVEFAMYPYGWSIVAGASVKLGLVSVMLIKLVELPEIDPWEGQTVEGGYQASNSVRASLANDLPWVAAKPPTGGS